MPDFIHEILSTSYTSFILLASGTNKTRGQFINKSLTNITKSKKLIDTQIQAIGKYCKNSQIVVSVGYESQALTRYILDKYPKIRIVENTNFKNTTPLETLRLCLNGCTESDTYIIYADRFFKSEAINIKNRSSPTIMESCDNKNKIDLGLVYDEKTFKRISYGVKNKWSQMFYLPKHFFYDFRKKVNESDKKYNNVYDVINQVAPEYKFTVYKTKSVREIL